MQELTKDHFAVAQDATGTKYVYQSIDESTKNHQDDDESYGGNMYAIGGDMCPVYTFQLYLSVLNDGNNFLFQRPKVGYFDNGKVMFDNARKGGTVLGNMMVSISTDADLSKRYTNHCIRATCVSLLDESFDPTHIMGVSMHKSLSSILSYRGRVKKSKKRDMSHSLTAACVASTSKQGSVTVESISSVPATCTALDSASNANVSEMAAIPNDVDMIDDELDKILQTVDLQQITQTKVTSAPVFNMYGNTSVVVHNHYY